MGALTSHVAPSYRKKAFGGHPLLIQDHFFAVLVSKGRLEQDHLQQDQQATTGRQRVRLTL